MRQRILVGLATLTLASTGCSLMRIKSPAAAAVDGSACTEKSRAPVIDALITLGFSPLEFLVLPRVIALCLMMPLLCLYSDLMGILGGAAVGLWMLDLSWTTYYHQTIGAITLTALFGGVFKSVTYGVLIALSGCLRGIQCGGSAAAVGEAATSAVVTSIVFIVAACGALSVIFYIIGV